MNTKIAIILFFLMFLHSGVNKIINYPKKITGLDNHTRNMLPKSLLHIGMIGVILLEIVGSIIIILHFWEFRIPKKIVEMTMYLFLLFLVVVTLLYHPPTDKIIPFLSNVTTFSGLLLIKNIL
jgi:hypothetical protein